MKRYPEIENALRHHIGETHGRRDRLEEVLGYRSESPMRGEGKFFIGLVGNMMALGHAPAQNEILKDAFANQAFEDFEISAYKPLVVVAGDAGQSDQISALKKSLEEEEAMSKTIADPAASTAKKYLALTLAGETADR